MQSQMLIAGVLSILLSGSTDLSGVQKSEESHKSEQGEKHKNVEVQGIGLKV